MGARPEPTADAAGLRRRLQHVRWVGGGSGAGKSTVARRVAARRGLRLYPTDDVMSEHAGRCTPEDGPLLSGFMAMNMDQRWVERSPETMLETFPWIQGEGFGLVVEDLLRLPPRPGVLVEGFRLLPRLVRPLLTDRSQAVWLLPSPAFRRAAFESRGSSWVIAGRTSDPERALRRLLDRDELFTDRLRAEATGLDLPAIEVGTAMTEDDLNQQVAAALGL